ncbi:MAG: hypothetical protein AAFO75_07400, partial [Pseudomonadota bacterium]
MQVKIMPSSQLTQHQSDAGVMPVSSTSTSPYGWTWFAFRGAAFAFGVALIAVLLGVGYVNQVKREIGSPP